MRISDWSSDVCSSDLRDLVEKAGRTVVFATAWRVSDHSKPIGIDGRTVTLSERKTELDVGLVGYKGEKNGEEVQLARPREWSYKDLKGALVVVTGGGSMNRDTYDAIQELRSEEHTSELQSLMRISYAVFCLKKKNTHQLRYYIQP